MDEARAELRRLLEKNTEYRENGFSVNVENDAAEWDRAIRQIGRKAAYALLGELVCAGFAEKNGAEYLFHETCVAYELQFHFDIYLRTAGFRGYPFYPASLPFSKQALLSHTGVVDIYTSDARDLKQRLMFRYRSGVRPKYRDTDKDPFRRI